MVISLRILCCVLTFASTFMSRINAQQIVAFNELHDVFSETVTIIETTRTSAVCPDGQVIVWGHVTHFNPYTHGANTCMRDNNKACTIGATSCTRNVCALTDGDESHVVAKITIRCAVAALTGAYSRTAVVSNGASGGGALCDNTDKVLFGFSFEYGRDLTACNAANNGACPLGQTSCSISASPTCVDQMAVAMIMCAPARYSDALSALGLRSTESNARTPVPIKCPPAGYTGTVVSEGQDYGAPSTLLFGFKIGMSDNYNTTTDQNTLVLANGACKYGESCTRAAISTPGNDVASTFATCVPAKLSTARPSTASPTSAPTKAPTSSPTAAPSEATSASTSSLSPSTNPTKSPSSTPTTTPTSIGEPVLPSKTPTKKPTLRPSIPVSTGGTLRPTNGELIGERDEDSSMMMTYIASGVGVLGVGMMFFYVTRTKPNRRPHRGQGSPFRSPPGGGGGGHPMASPRMQQRQQNQGSMYGSQYGQSQMQFRTTVVPPPPSGFRASVARFVPFFNAAPVASFSNNNGTPVAALSGHKPGYGRAVAAAPTPTFQQNFRQSVARFVPGWWKGHTSPAPMAIIPQAHRRSPPPQQPTGLIPVTANVRQTVARFIGRWRGSSAQHRNGNGGHLFAEKTRFNSSPRQMVTNPSFGGQQHLNNNSSRFSAPGSFSSNGARKGQGGQRGLESPRPMGRTNNKSVRRGQTHQNHPRPIFPQGISYSPGM